MNDLEFAEELVRRLNKVVSTPEIKADVAKLFKAYVNVSQETIDSNFVVNKDNQLSAIGFVNGLCGKVRIAPILMMKKQMIY